MTLKMVAVGFWAGWQLRKVEAAPLSIWAAFHIRARTQFFKYWWWRRDFEGVQLSPLQSASRKHGKINLCCIICGRNLISLISDHLWLEVYVFTPPRYSILCGWCIGGTTLLLQWWILRWFLQVVRLWSFPLIIPRSVIFFFGNEWENCLSIDAVLTVCLSVCLICLIIQGCAHI